MTPTEEPREEGSEEREDLPPRDSGDAAAIENEAAVATEQIEDELEEELDRLRDRLLRLQAEFDNFRKREARERAAAWARAKADLVQKLLGALDDLDRVAHLDPRTATSASVIGGVGLVERKLMDALEREGLVAVGEAGEPFDPNIHEAISTLPAPSAEHEGRVATVAVRGFRFGPQLLRPAQVQVYASGR